MRGFQAAEESVAGHRLGEDQAEGSGPVPCVTEAGPPLETGREEPGRQGLGPGWGQGQVLFSGTAAQAGSCEL